MAETAQPRLRQKLQNWPGFPLSIRAIKILRTRTLALKTRHRVWKILQENTTMQPLKTPAQLCTNVSPTDDDRRLLLEEVEFKWLMAGQGWWIDTERLHTDLTYATQLLDLVAATESDTLKDWATLLRSKLGLRPRVLPCTKVTSTEKVH